MGRFHDALQKLARRGYFTMEPSQPIGHDIPVPSDRKQQAWTSPPSSHPIEIAAALPQLRVDAPPAARLQVDTMVELFHVDHDDDQKIAIFEPIMIDAGLRRSPLRTQSHSVESEQSCSDDNTCDSSEEDVDWISTITRIEQISHEFDSITRDETPDDVQVSDLNPAHDAHQVSDVTEVAEIQDTDEIDKVDEIDDVDEIDKVDEIDDVDEIQDVEEIHNADEIHEVVDFSDVSPYRPVLHPWAVFPDRQDAPEQNDEGAARTTVEPIVASGPAAGPSSSAGSLADTFDPVEQPAQVEPTCDKAAGSTSFPPTAYEAELAERLRTPSYGERIQQLSHEIFSHPAGDGPGIVLFLSMDIDNQRADAATALALYRCKQRTLPTLLIDADIDSRHVSREFHMNDAGLIEAISGQVPWDDSVRQTSSEHLRLLPCGTDIGFISPDSEQEEFQRITQFVDQWREHYGLVLIDGGLIDSPLAPVLTRASDATFIYVQLGKSRREELAAAVARLEKAGGNIQGCITTGPAT